MKGINRAIDIRKTFKLLSDNKNYSKTEVPCIFISHQKKDTEYAKEIADYIISKEIDVYYDEYDKNLKFDMQKNNPEGVTDCILKGIKESDDMLVIVSENTYKSQWVPFEIGYAYEDRVRELKILRHKGLNKNILPEYLKTVEIVNGYLSLDKYLSSLKKRYNLYESIEKNRIKKFSYKSIHPLNDILDNE